MKKLAMLLLCSGLLVACSSSGYTVKVSDGSSVLLSGQGISISKQDYFEHLLDAYGSNQILSDALTTIADKEVTDKNAINKLLDERIKTYTQYSEGNFEDYAKSLGYESKEEYINDALLPDVKQELLRNKYIKENLDSLMKEYQVTSLKKIVVSKESTALAIIKESTSVNKFNEQMKKYSDNAEDAGIVTKNSSLDEKLLKQLETLSQVKKDSVYDKAIPLSDGSYAVVYLYNTAKTNKDDYINALTSDANVQESVEGIYLKKYNFSVNDSQLKKAIKQISSEYIE